MNTPHLINTSEHIMTPNEFAQQMREVGMSGGLRLIGELLRSLGYGEGMDIFSKQFDKEW